MISAPLRPVRATWFDAMCERVSWVQVTLGATVVTWLILLVRYLPCRPGAGAASPYQAMCYSDITALFGTRGLAEGNTPYFDTGNYQVLEYPVGTGYFIELTRIISNWFAPQGAGLDTAASQRAADAFLDVNTVALYMCFLATVIAHVRLGTARQALLIAASPLVMAAGLINWDMLVLALTSWALVAWSDRRLLVSGLLLGVATAVKLYPALLLGPLLILCLRRRQTGAFLSTLNGTILGWVMVNLPVMVWAPAQWREFWGFNSDRGADLGSWSYALKLLGVEVSHVNIIGIVVMAALCAGIAAVIWWAPITPRLGQVAFLVVLAFVLTNKVYSPQYVLWLVPLLALARPTAKVWIWFTAGELYYFIAIWWHLSQATAPVGEGPDYVYISAIVARIVVQLAVGAVVVRDCLRPAADPLRTPGGEDVIGGVLNDGGDGCGGSGSALTCARSA